MLARFFILLLLVLVPLACNEPGTPPVRIAVIGDSLSDGVNPETAPRKLGWVQLLDKGGEKHAALRALWPRTELRNYSISGSTAGQWNSEAYLAKAIGGKPHVAVVYLGANAVLHAIHGRGFTGATLLALSNDISGILTRLKAGVPGVRLVLIEHYDLFDGQSARLADNPAFRKYAGMSDIVRRGNALLAGIAAAQGALLVPLAGPFRHHAYGAGPGGLALLPSYFRRPLSLFDIHPVTEGYRALADQVLAALRRLQTLHPLPAQGK